MTLNCVLQLRLDELALRKVVIMMWNQMDTLSHFGVNDLDSYPPFKTTFKTDVERLQTKLMKLELPGLLLHKALPLTRVVGLEIIKWIDFHLEFFRFPYAYLEREKKIRAVVTFEKVLKKLSWSSVGTIKYRETAEELIRCEFFSYFLLYKLACLYCLEDQVRILWDKLPVMIKDSFYDKKDIFQIGQSHLDAFWTNIIRYTNISGGMDREPFENIDNFYQQAFNVSANIGSKAATEYFYQKLTYGEKENYLLETAQDVAKKCKSSIYTSRELRYNRYSDTLCYLLSQMINEKQIALFQAHPYNVSICFLVWPWQDLFSDVVQLTLEFLSRSSYCDLLRDICIKTISRDTKLNLFEEFFRRSPEYFKSFFIDQECRGNFLEELFIAGDSEIIRCVFKNIEPAAQVRLALCYQGLSICCYLIQEEKWNLLNLFTCEAILSDAYRDLLTRDLMSNILEYFGKTLLRSKLKKWEQFYYCITKVCNESHSLKNLEIESNPSLE